jgi:hypothetical protein
MGLVHKTVQYEQSVPAQYVHEPITELSIFKQNIPVCIDVNEADLGILDGRSRVLVELVSHDGKQPDIIAF